MSKSDFYKSSVYSRRALMAGVLGASVGAAVSQAYGAPHGFFFGLGALQPGFDLSEALDMLQMCNYIYGGAPTPLKPAKWDVVYDPSPLPFFDNKWQLWKMRGFGGPYAIIIRGTVAETGSVVEDLLSLLIKANDKITVDKLEFPYKFADEPDAAVHLGFALGALLLLKWPVSGILDKLASLNIPANTPIYIAGHSQGAAVAILIRSYLFYANSKYPHKTYVFAQPKPGNDHYGTDFDSRFSNKGYAFRLTNSLDWVPQAPFTFEIPSDLNKPNPLDSGASLSAAATSYIASLTASQTQAYNLILEKEKPRIQKGGSALLKTIDPQAGEAASVEVPLVASLYFTGAGTEVALIGQPCNLPGSQCNEWYQHHLSTYSALMRQQLKSTGL